jgi:hypothetical protein
MNFATVPALMAKKIAGWVFTPSSLLDSWVELSKTSEQDSEPNFSPT